VGRSPGKLPYGELAYSIAHHPLLRERIQLLWRPLHIWIAWWDKSDLGLALLAQAIRSCSFKQKLHELEKIRTLAWVYFGIPSASI